MTERPSFLSAIVELQLSTREELEEALVRQLIYGGDLPSNILELGLAAETGVGQSLALSGGLPYRPAPHQVERQGTVTLLEGGHRVLVQRTGPNEYLVVGSDAASLRARVAEFSDILTSKVSVALDLPFRIEEALVSVTGGGLPARCQALVARWGARPSTIVEAPAAAAPEVEERAVAPEAMPEPVLAVPSEFDDRDLPEGGITEPPPVNYAQITADAAADEAAASELRGGKPSATAALVESVRASRSTRPVDSSAMDGARRALLEARDRDAIFDIVLDVTKHYFEYAVLFAVSGNEARGLSAVGRGASTAEIASLKIPLDLSSPFRKTAQAGVHQLARLRASGLEGGVAQDLKRPTGRRVLLLPIVLRGRAVMLLWGDQGQRDVELESVGEVIALGPAVARAFERVLLERKRQSMIPESAAMIGQLTGLLNKSENPPAQAPLEPARSMKISLASEYKPGPIEEALRAAPERRSEEVVARTASGSFEAPVFEPTGSLPLSATTPGAHDPGGDITRRDTSAKRPLVEMEVESPARPSTISQRSSPRPISRFGPPSSSVDSTEHVDTQRIAAAPEAREQTVPPPRAKPAVRSPLAPPVQEAPEPDDGQKPGSHEVAPNAPRTLDQDPGFPSEAPRTWKGFPGSPLPPDVAPDAPEPPPVIARAPQRGPAPSLAMKPRRIVTLDSKVLPLGQSSTQAPLGTVDASPPLFAPPEVRSSGTLVSRRPLMNEPPEEGWGTTISPVPSRRPGGPKSYDQLVERLCQGESGSLEQLVDGGESAVASLIARFPGPIREPENAQTKASDCGPLLRALVRIGQKAVPFLTVRTADENPEVRRWATLVLGELPSRDSAKAIAGRLLDGAPLVRRAALASARRLQSDTLARRTLRGQIEELTLDVRLGTEARCSAIEAIADIREYETIPVLLQILGDKDRSVARASQWALSVLTRQDYGSDFVQWQTFWQEHRNEPRIEWLIAALGHEKADLRRAAYEEIKAAAGQDFGFHEDLPEEERNEIRGLVHTWWSRSGRKS